MIIVITKDIRLTLDEVSSTCTIERRHVAVTGKNAGKESWYALGYHGSVKAAAESLLTRHVHLITEMEQADLFALIDAVHRGAALIVERITAAMSAQHEETGS